MEKPNIKDYYKTKEDGSKEFDESAYEAAMQSYIDDQRRVASETAKKNGIAEGKKQAEETAKMSAEERLKKEREDFEKEKQDVLAKFKEKEVAFNKERIKALYTTAGFSEKETEALLLLVGEDYDSSQKSANELIGARKTALEEYKNTLMKDIQSGQPDPQGNGGDGKKEKTVAQQMAESYKSSNESQTIQWGNFNKNE